MSKMSELSQVLDELISCGEKMIQTANAIKECFSEGAPAKEAEPAAPEKSATKAPAKEATPSYSKEDVRALLAAKANEAGGRYKAQVKAIVRKYADGGTLTSIPAESYAALVKEVEELHDA